MSDRRRSRSNGTGARLVRLVSLVRLLSSRRRGATIASLRDHHDISRATLYRDLAALEAAGIPLERTTVNGEARVRIAEGALERQVWTPDETLALGLASAVLGPLAGTRLARALAGIAKGASPQVAVAVVQRPPPADPAVNAALERAVRDERWVRVLYRATNDKAARERRLEPVELRLHDGALYVVARDGGAFKTFKAARFEHVELLEVRSDARAAYDEAQMHAHAVGIWSGEPVDVEVRLDASVARFAAEWPLRPDQEVIAEPSGSVLVRARVAGQVEALRWALRWGRRAEVLSPPSLRAAMREELEGALAHYGLSRTLETRARDDGSMAQTAHPSRRASSAKEPVKKPTTKPSRRNPQRAGA